jgi:hypothetical protein
MSFMPASIFRIWRTERGIRSSRTIPLRTTGSVEASTAPPMNESFQSSPSNRASGTAPSAMIIPVPGPSTSAGTTHLRPSSSICSCTASRNSTKERVRVATISRISSSRPISTTPMPPSPRASPRPRNMRGKDSGERSTSPEASAVTISTVATTPKATYRSGTPHSRHPIPARRKRDPSSPKTTTCCSPTSVNR